MSNIDWRITGAPDGLWGDLNMGYAPQALETYRKIFPQELEILYVKLGQLLDQYETEARNIEVAEKIIETGEKKVSNAIKREEELSAAQEELFKAVSSFTDGCRTKGVHGAMTDAINKYQDLAKNTMRLGSSVAVFDTNATKSAEASNAIDKSKANITNIVTIIEQTLAAIRLQDVNGKSRIDNLAVRSDHLQFVDKIKGISPNQIVPFKNLFFSYCNMRIASFKNLDTLAYEVMEAHKAEEVINFGDRKDSRVDTYYLLKCGTNMLSDVFSQYLCDLPLSGEYERQTTAAATAMTYYANYLNGYEAELGIIELYPRIHTEADVQCLMAIDMLKKSASVTPVRNKNEGHQLN